MKTDKYSLEMIKKKTPDKPLSYYPIWRRWMARLSFYGVYIIVNFLGVKNPVLLSISMIALGITGGLLLSLVNTPLQYLGIFLMWLSYFIDMMDGKTARLFDRTDSNNKWIGKFLDWNYHPLMMSAALFSVGYRAYSKSGNILFLYLGFFVVYVFIYKYYLNMLYLVWKYETTCVNNSGFNFEKLLEKRYMEYKSINGVLYTTLRYLTDSVDLIFTITLVVVAGIERYFVLFLSILYLGLLLFSVLTKYREIGEGV